MAKEVVAKIKLQVPGGQATPAPPVGPALGGAGLSPGEFCTRFNERTKDQHGTIIPVVITVYSDRTFDFITKSPPASVLLKKEAGLAKGANTPGREAPVGKVTKEQLRKIAEIKMADLNAYDVERAINIIAGTARSMGIEVEE
ncbi:MAG: 50S ribosomal protein L11 [Planctomycetota bacterium]|jgi:large subunit ribosomal protein L11